MTDAFRERGFVRSQGLGKLCGHVSLLYEQSERQAGQQMRRKEENGATPTVTSCSRIPLALNPTFAGLCSLFCKW